MIFFLTIPALGLLVSLVSVFIGLGGGVILVPLFPSLFQLSIHESVATSLLTVFLVVSENTYRFHKKKEDLINWPVVWLMGIPATFMAMIASQISKKVRGDRIFDILIIILILIALKNFFFSFSKKDSTLSPLGAKEKLFSAGAGILAGLTSGFAGVGSGVILSPVMILLKTVKSAQLAPTANASMVFVTFGACLSLFITEKPVQWNQWGLIRLDIALGLFLSALFFNNILRPYQNKLSIKIKSFLLSLVLSGLILKILLARTS